MVMTNSYMEIINIRAILGGGFFSWQDIFYLVDKICF